MHSLVLVPIIDFGAVRSRIELAKGGTLMEAKCFSLNQRLLDQSEKRFLEADLKEFLATAESPELLEDENQSVWLKKFIEGYYQWKGRRFQNSRYPLYSYFVIKGVSKDSK